MSNNANKETRYDQEILKRAAMKYFRRQIVYGAVDLLKGKERRTMDLSDMDLNNAVARCVSVPCSVLFYSESITLTAAIEEYKGLIEFVKRIPEDQRRQFASFLYPMYVYMYLGMLRNGQILNARKFYTSYCKLFEKAEGYSDVVLALADLQTSNDVRKHPYFKLFWEEKYIVKISGNGLELLKRHLKDTESTILLSLLHFQFFIEGETEYKPYDSDDFFEEAKDYFVTKGKFTFKKNESKAINQCKEVIKKVARRPLPAPETYMYTIECGKENVSAVDMNSDKSRLAYSFGKSSIHLWSLTDDLPLSKIYEVGLSNTEFPVNDSTLENENNRCQINSQFRMHETLIGHGGSVFGLAFTSRYDLLMSCSEDKTVRAWNTKTMENVAFYKGHEMPIWDVNVSSDSSYFASASEDSTACLWTFERPSPLRIFAGHTSSVDCVDFHANGNYVATASCDKTIRLWTTQDARAVRYFPGHDSFISCLAFSPNGKYLASADDSGCIKIWDIASSLQIKELPGHKDRIFSMSFNGNDSLLASGGFDPKVKVWDVRTSVEIKPKKPKKSGASKSKKAKPPAELVVSYDTGRIYHLVRFSTNDLLISVGTRRNVNK